MPPESAPLIRTIPHGATWTQFNIPSSSSNSAQNILLSFPSDELFATHPHPYFGNTIGRIANRISDGTVPNVNGKTYHVSINEGSSSANESGNCLHGGTQGWGAKTWSGPETITLGVWDAGIANLQGGNQRNGLQYTLLSPDGDEGFPGSILAKTTYFEGRGSKGEIVLEIEYEARISDDSPVDETVISMTNHAYFNLNGAMPGAQTREEEWNLHDHTISLATSEYLVLRRDRSGIPSGEIGNHPLVLATPGTVFSLADAEGKTRFIDDCFIVEKDQGKIDIDSRHSAAGLQTLATVKGEKSGVLLRIESTEPAFQLYTGKFVDVGPFAGSKGYASFAGLCVEPSRYVDAAGGREEWKDQVLLRKGKVYGARNRYWAWRE